MGKSDEIKRGANVGGGPPPGFRWNVEYLTVAEDQARAFLTGAQVDHVIEQFRSLAGEPHPTHPLTVSVDAVADFHELRVKGGPLGKINGRFFFIVHERTIVVLGAMKKESDGATSPATKRLMSARRKKYLNGDYGVAQIPEREKERKGG